MISCEGFKSLLNRLIKFEDIEYITISSDQKKILGSRPD